MADNLSFDGHSQPSNVSSGTHSIRCSIGSQQTLVSTQELSFAEQNSIQSDTSGDDNNVDISAAGFAETVVAPAIQPNPNFVPPTSNDCVVFHINHSCNFFGFSSFNQLITRTEMMCKRFLVGKTLF